MTGRRTGRCECGAVTYEATLKDGELHACHCPMCRRIVAGPFIGCDVSDITFAEGAPITVYQSSAWATRTFCARCGTALAWQALDGHFKAVGAWTLDEPPEKPLTLEIFIDAKPEGYAFAGDASKMTRAEIMAFIEGAAAGPAGVASR